ncbi:hypothetical protein D9M71_186240 [compost metagenome]
MQAWQRVRHRRRLGERRVFGLQWPLRRFDGDVVARYQGFQAGHSGQGDLRLHQPETGLIAQVRSGFLAHLDGRHHALHIGGDMYIGHLANSNALVDHLGLVHLDAFAAFEVHLDVHSSLAVCLPGQPASDRQGDQRQNPDRRPVRCLASLRGGQISHRFHPCPCYPRSAGDQKSLQPAW